MDKIVAAVLVDDKAKVVVEVKKEMDHDNVVVEKNGVEKNGEECCSSYMHADYGFVFVVDYERDEDFVQVKEVKVVKEDMRL